MRYCWMLALTARAARGLARTSATTSATAPNKVVFVGAGSFGSAMALVAARAQPDASIKIWARRDAVVDEINTKRRNGRYLPEDQDPFPSNVEATTDLNGAVADANIVVLAVPGEFLGTTLEQIDTCLGINGNRGERLIDLMSNAGRHFAHAAQSVDVRQALPVFSQRFSRSVLACQVPDNSSKPLPTFQRDLADREIHRKKPTIFVDCL